MYMYMCTLSLNGVKEGEEVRVQMLVLLVAEGPLALRVSLAVMVTLAPLAPLASLVQPALMVPLEVILLQKVA